MSSELLAAAPEGCSFLGTSESVHRLARVSWTPAGIPERYTDPIPTCVWRPPHTNKQFLRCQLGVWAISSILALSTQRENQLRTGGSDDPLQPRMPSTSPSCYLYCWPTGYKTEVPTTPSLGSINLLELRKTRVLTRLPIYYKRMLKDTNQQPYEKVHRAESQTKELGARPSGEQKHSGSSM